VAALGCTVAPMFASEYAAYAAYDTLLTVRLPETPAGPPQRLIADLPALASSARRAELLLERALCDRVTAISVWVPKAEPAPIGSSELPGLGERPFLCIGLRLNKSEVRCLGAIGLKEDSRRFLIKLLVEWAY
jgi:hypothetical protein